MGVKRIMDKYNPDGTLKAVEDKYRRLRCYPILHKERTFSDQPLPWSPTIGKFYKVMDKKTGKTITGMLDHSARMFGGAVLGFLYSEDGQLIGSMPVTLHALWFMEVKG